MTGILPNVLDVDIDSSEAPPEPLWALKRYQAALTATPENPLSQARPLLIIYTVRNTF